MGTGQGRLIRAQACPRRVFLRPLPVDSKRWFTQERRFSFERSVQESDQHPGPRGKSDELPGLDVALLVNLRLDGRKHHSPKSSTSHQTPIRPSRTVADDEAGSTNRRGLGTNDACFGRVSANLPTRRITSGLEGSPGPLLPQDRPVSAPGTSSDRLSPRRSSWSG